MMEGMKRAGEDMANKLNKEVTSACKSLSELFGEEEGAEIHQKRLDKIDERGDELRALRSQMNEGEEVESFLDTAIDMANTQAEAAAVWAADHPMLSKHIVGEEKIHELGVAIEMGAKAQSREIKDRLEEKGFSYEYQTAMGNASEREIYSIANNNSSIAERNFNVAMNHAEQGIIAPQISGLPGNKQEEIYTAFIEQGGEPLSFITKAPQALGPSRKDYEEFTEIMLGKLQDKSNRINYSVVLLENGGLLECPRFPSELAIKIARVYLAQIHKGSQFELGRRGDQLRYIFSDRSSNPQIRAFEEEVEEKRAKFLVA